MSQEPQEKVSSCKRIIQTMQAVQQTRGKWFTHTDMLQRLGFPAGSMSRYLKFLVEEGVLEQEEQYGPYRLSEGSTDMLMREGLALFRAAKGAEA